MLSRFSPSRIVKLHFEAFRDLKGAIPALDRVALFFVPVVCGSGVGVAVYLGLDLRDGISQVLAATTLLVGALLSTFVFLTNLRIKLSESPTYAFRGSLHKLVAGSAAGSLYVAGFAMLVAAALAAVASVDILRSPGVQPFTAGVVVALGVHLAVNLLSLSRRLFGIYYLLFASDFDPELETDDSYQSDSRKRSRRGTGARGSKASQSRR